MIRKPRLKSRKDGAPKMSYGGMAGAGNMITALSLMGAVMAPSIDNPMDLSTDAIHSTVQGDFRGNFSEQTGMFRPDQQGSYSPDGMHRGNYFADGGPYFGGGMEELTSIPALPASPLEGFNFSIPVTDSDYGIGAPEKKPATTGDLTKNPDSLERARKAYEHLVSGRNIEPHIAAGIVGNLMHESGGFADDVIRAKKTGDGGLAKGIAQWHPDRWNGFLKWASKNGRHPYDMKSQLDYVVDEPGEGKRALDKARRARNAGEAAVLWGRTFERPSERTNPETGRAYADWQSRQKYATSLFTQANRKPAINPKSMYRTQKFEEGGEYEMSPVELIAFLSNGGKVDYL